ncbi:Alpha-ketoglutarate-dependent dioxygenase AlkB [Morus notabilis]|uniref:DNA N(6)-methyladenine demethylase n=1 Tax=Morus notabilis TaxID=981085 RepID=W9RP27_9ROSA|nr:Alpha-ketoglutarate-dependent dioxygenase AlkB [Morus notabilis]
MAVSIAVEVEEAHEALRTAQVDDNLWAPALNLTVVMIPREKFQAVYVAKTQEGQNSSEAVNGVSEVNSVIASDLPHNGNSPPLTSPLGPSLSTGEEKTQIEISQQVENCLPPKHGDEDVPLSIKSLKTPASDRKFENSESSEVFEPFDICLPKTSAVKLKPSLLATNRERRNETKRTTEGLNGRILRPGMVLLKSYISISTQTKIVKRCRHLGLGPGGFYQPGYRDGAKLHLNMMCLGKNWDPQTSKYGDYRPTDGAKPPPIPKEFYELVMKAIEDSHVLIRKESEAGNAEQILPRMTPDICLVNFYSTNGRLGLHQDRDESHESIRKGLPVVSFSIGDAADFKYGDQRDVDTAKEVMLESGDVLIFGGDARYVFHGVTTIHTNTAPKTLLEQTDLRPGRVNLTFRQY